MRRSSFSRCDGKADIGFGSSGESSMAFEALSRCGVGRFRRTVSPKVDDQGRSIRKLCGQATEYIYYTCEEGMFDEGV